jgi:hypothetical protein
MPSNTKKIIVELEKKGKQLFRSKNFAWQHNVRVVQKAQNNFLNDQQQK